MEIKNIIQEELKSAGYEMQMKYRAQISEEDIFKLKGRKVGSVIHNDKFFVKKDCQVNESNELVRLRKEGEDDLLFTYKGPVANKDIRTRVVVNKIATPQDINNITKEYKEIISVHKKRTIFILNEVRVSIDKVEHLGEFVELEVMKEEDAKKIHDVADQLGLNSESATRLSYFELALMNMTPLHRFMFKVYEKFGHLTFGISSAVLTTMGIITSLNFATNSKIAVIGGIISVAVADSMSESVGIYSSKKSERGVSSATALKSALGTFWGKAIFTFSFLVPFLLLPSAFSLIACMIWGLALLIFINVQIAFIKEENIIKTVITNILVAVLIIFLSYLAGKIVAHFG